ncbi:MAG: flagellar biosynthesis protein FlhF [Phycisphaerales bacterium]|nr:flagellar biosynthesis protein FlhF [Phycisphaerales bacterium]
MKLKTYTAETMAQALAHVRKDLGKDAMILHTRSFRVGSWFGLGGKTMVEITASSSAKATKSNSPRLMPRVATQRTQLQPAQPQPVESKPLEREPEIVIQRGRTVTRQRLTVDAPAVQVAQGVSASDSESDDRGLAGRDALFSSDAPPQTPTRGSTKDSLRIPANTPSRFANQPVASAMITNTNSFPRQPIAQQVAQQIEPKPTPRQSSKPVGESSTTKIGAQTATQADEQTNDQLRSQIETLSKMMGQVLESTRKTAVAVGTGKVDGVLPSGEMPAPLFALYAKMMDNDVPVDLADKLVGSVRDRLDAVELKDALIVRQALLRAIEATISTRSESLLTIDHHSSTGRPRVIALVGPTGVGKTTTVAKLAATYKLRHGKNVGLITSDTYRIAAVEQLRTYAGIIGLPLKVANSPEELSRSIEELSDCDIVVIDTAGRSQNNAKRLGELAEFTKAANPDETHLVLSTTVGDNVLRKTAERFKALGPDRCILTKLDEAVTTGPIAGLSDRIGLPLSFITVGQEVPDDLEPARADRLARCVLDGPEAVVGRWSEDNG